jgi:hypothetical protein
MTDQRDPYGRRPNYIRRDDGSWNALPIALVVLLIVGIGFLVFYDGTPENSSTVTSQQQSERAKSPNPPTNKQQ